LDVHEFGFRTVEAWRKEKMLSTKREVRGSQRKGEGIQDNGLQIQEKNHIGLG
jgi:hypothetical protein